jgi:hypothetical protein
LFSFCIAKYAKIEDSIEQASVARETFAEQSLNNGVSKPLADDTPGF